MTSLTVDIVIEHNGSILLIKRKFPPYEGCLALPGGFVEEGETVETAAARELLEETQITVHPSIMKLLGVYSEPGRDPRGRVVSVAFRHTIHALYPRPHAEAGDDAARVHWVPLEQIDNLLMRNSFAFDHGQIIRDYLRAKG